MSKIHAKESILKDVFSSEYAFCIPDYQRPYRWETEQSTALLNDILDASATFDPSRDDEHKDTWAPYFLGSCVLIKGEGNASAEVIDGQQRLTSLSLLFSAIKACSTDKEIQDSMQGRLYEKGNKAEGTKDRVRLRLRERDHGFYETQILGKGLEILTDLKAAKLPDPQRRMLENFSALVEKLKPLSPERVAALATYLNLYTYLVVVCTADLDSAFRIFSVLNDRGLPLGAADIMKAEIISKVPPREREAYNEKWEDLEEDLGTEGFSDLFSHVRMIHVRKKLKTTVLAELRDEVKPSSDARKFIDEQLLPYGIALGHIIHGNYEAGTDDKEINRYLAYLKRLGDRDWVPPAIAFMAKYAHAPGRILSFLKDLERLAMGMWLMQFDVNSRINRYAGIIADILAGNQVVMDLSVGEKQKVVDVLDGGIYEMSQKPKRTAILLRLDEALASAEAFYQFDQITIEHVLPQTPAENSKWLEWWPDPAQREANVHRLGNLALLNRRQNSAAKNWELDVKKAKYFQTKGGGSPFQMTSEVLAAAEWTPSVFEARQAKLLAKLKDVWRLV